MKLIGFLLSLSDLMEDGTVDSEMPRSMGRNVGII